MLYFQHRAGCGDCLMMWLGGWFGVRAIICRAARIRIEQPHGLPPFLSDGNQQRLNPVYISLCVEWCCQCVHSVLYVIVLGWCTFHYVWNGVVNFVWDCIGMGVLFIMYEMPSSWCTFQYIYGIISKWCTFHCAWNAIIRVYMLLGCKTATNTSRYLF